MSFRSICHIRVVCIYCPEAVSTAVSTRRLSVSGPTLGLKVGVRAPHLAQLISHLTPAGFGQELMRLLQAFSGSIHGAPIVSMTRWTHLWSAMRTRRRL